MLAWCEGVKGIFTTSASTGTSGVLAYSIFQEKIKGSIESEKLADLVFIPRDLSSVPIEEIAQLKVGMTMVNGEIAYGEV